MRLPVVDSYDQMKVHATVTEARLRSFCKARSVTHDHDTRSGALSAKWLCPYYIVDGTRGNTETTQYVENGSTAQAWHLHLLGLQSWVLTPPQIFP